MERGEGKDPGLQWSFIPSPRQLLEAAGQQTAKVKPGTLTSRMDEEGGGGNQGRKQTGDFYSCLWGRRGSPELRDRHGGWKGGITSRVLTREGSLEANERVSMGTIDSAPGKLALLALESYFSHSHKPLG